MAVDLSKVLVVGLKDLDAGKTTVARALLSIVREDGEDSCGFKPKAGNTIWYDYDVVYEALSQGRLYGKDSKLLKEASGTDLPEEAISPYHRLYAIPPEHGRRGLMELPYFIVDRVSLWRPRPRQLVVVNDALPANEADERGLKNLYASADRVAHVHSLSELNNEVRRYCERAIASAHSLIEKRHDGIVYESYADVALPWSGIVGLDMVLAVEPGYLIRYDPDRYLSAVRMYQELSKEVTTKSVMDLLKPEGVLRIPPCRSSQIIDVVKARLRRFL